MLVFLSFVVCHKCLSLYHLYSSSTPSIHPSWFGSSSRCFTPFSGRFERFLFTLEREFFTKALFGFIDWRYTRQGKAKQARLASNWAKHLCGYGMGYSNRLHFGVFSMLGELVYIYLIWWDVVGFEIYHALIRGVGVFAEGVGHWCAEMH